MPRKVVRREGDHLYARPPGSPEGRRLSDAILRLRQAERVQSERAQRASGLSALDLTALRYLVQADRDGVDVSPKDVIVMLDTSSATVTNVIERLVVRGYLTRLPHPTDRRAHYLKPTDAAVDRVDDAFSAHHAAVVAVIEDLDAAEAAAAADVLERLVHAMDALVPPPD
jgi:DNA-binding MarR family transcriptional regulator